MTRPVDRLGSRPELALVALLVAWGAAACSPSSSTAIFGPVSGRTDLSLATCYTEISDGLSGDVLFKVPQGTASILIEVRGKEGVYYLSKLKPPSGTDLVESGAIVTREAREVPGLVDWMYPNNPDIEIESGSYRLIVRGETAQGERLSEEAEVLIYAKQASSPDECGLHLDFLVDQTAVVEFEEAIDAVVSRLVSLYYQAGVGIIDYQVQQITVPTPDVDVSGGSWRATLSVVDDILKTGLQQGSARKDAMHVIVVRSLGEAAGYAMGLPGPYAPDRPTSAVLAASDAWADMRGYLDLDAMYTTVAHEIGHYLGLYHTTEHDGLNNDPIADTPTCSSGSCFDDLFVGNIMTPGEGARRHLLTRGQATVIKRHPLCSPRSVLLPPPKCGVPCTAPEICAIWSGKQTCLPACDPHGDPCASARSCVTDDVGVYVCAPAP
jgi:hypothetical protein